MCIISGLGYVNFWAERFGLDIQGGRALRIGEARMPRTAVRGLSAVARTWKGSGAVGIFQTMPV